MSLFLKLDNIIMQMKKPMFRLVVCNIVLILFLNLFSTVIVSGDMQRPEWHEGNYWIYDITIFSSYYGNVSGTEQIKVFSPTNITIDNNSYFARRIKIDRDIFTTKNNATIDLGFEELRYYNEQDFSLMQINKKSKYVGYIQYIYSYPFVGITWPIFTGKSWKRSTNITLVNSTGSYSTFNSFNYSCIGTENISTNAGFFNSTYELRLYGKNSKDTYTIEYLSPEVGYFPVKYVEYINEDIYLEKQLVSYDYGPYPNNTSNDTGNGDSTPGFIISSFLIILMFYVIIFIKKRK